MQQKLNTWRSFYVIYNSHSYQTKENIQLGRFVFASEKTSMPAKATGFNRTSWNPDQKSPNDYRVIVRCTWSSRTAVHNVVGLALGVLSLPRRGVLITS